MASKPTLASAVSAFGSSSKAKLSNPSAAGQPEDQLRAPLEQLFADLADLAGIPRKHVIAVGETSLSDLKTRPDYAITVHGALVGFVEIKAPGKGADPRKFKDPHDKAQWERLRSLPNLIYTDGNSFSLWHDGELVGTVVPLDGDIESSGAKLTAPGQLVVLFESFLRWEPAPPRSVKELAGTSARLCRLLRDEVTEQMERHSEALTALAADWRKLLFPDATDERFADGYAQAITFGLLMARAKEIPLSSGLQAVAAELTKSNSLIGAALRLLTDSAENQETLKTSLGTLTRVLDVVDWAKISKGKPDAWLYFYEDFLEVYDNALRKLTGSYYTPPEVVGAMVRLVDDALKSHRFGQSAGLASPAVTLVDPATGTGTFLLGVLRRIAETVADDEGPGTVPAAIEAAAARLIAFEMQLGPFAVAQLRILAEIVELTGKNPKTSARMFVTNTLGNPYAEQEWLPSITEYRTIGESRRLANKIKRDEPITVVIGNPPYKEKAKGLGGWVEGVDADPGTAAPLAEWMPPPEWGAGAHSKHLRNLYVYFWRWATWKVFDHQAHSHGIVCYITVAGFLSGPGFQKMRDYLRRTCDDIWVIDCSPEGHQPDVPTRIFQGVQQPVCIVLASRSKKKSSDVPATVRFNSLPLGKREAKFAALTKITLGGKAWIECPTEWRAPFLPESTGAWATYPKLEELFEWNGSGVMPGRTWIIAPDVSSLEARWQTLTTAPATQKEALFHPHMRNEEVGDKHSKKIVEKPLFGFAPRKLSVSNDSGDCIPPIRYGNRSFDRQWIVPDSRLINQPNPELWRLRSEQQVFLNALARTSPTEGPAFSITGLVPDLDHYNGRGGRVFPLWRDAEATIPNFRPKLISALSERYGAPVTAQDLFAYLAAIAAHPAFTARFQDDLSTPGLRIPLTAEAGLFAEAAALGREVVWLHTFGERFTDVGAGRPPEPPRMPKSKRPGISSEGAIPSDPDGMPDSLNYDSTKQRLLVGRGWIDHVSPAVWNYTVSGKQVLMQWFSYRKKSRERPIIGDRRPPSLLGNIQPDHWLPEYTTELLNVLNILGLLVEKEPMQAMLLEKICSAPLFAEDALREAGCFEPSISSKRTVADDAQGKLFSDSASAP